MAARKTISASSGRKINGIFRNYTPHVFGWFVFICFCLYSHCRLIYLSDLAGTFYSETKQIARVSCEMIKIHATIQSCA